jgi:hypothetical protein
MERSSPVTQIPGARAPEAREHSTGELVKMMTEQMSVLVRNEMKLAQLEMTRKGKQAALGAGMFGASGLVAFYGVGCLLACAIIAVLLATAGIAALLGKQRLQRATPPVPEEAVASTKADVDEIKERAHR